MSCGILNNLLQLKRTVGKNEGNWSKEYALAGIKPETWVYQDGAVAHQVTKPGPLMFFNDIKCWQNCIFLELLVTRQQCDYMHKKISIFISFELAFLLGI